MSNSKIVHYNMDEIDKIGANYNLIWGERSNGKSYQVKHKKGVIKYLKTGRRFILMRRWKEEITTEKIDSYFESFKKLAEVNRYVKTVSSLKKEAVDYQRYLAYQTSGSIYNPENISQQTQYLLEELNNALILLKHEI